VHGARDRVRVPGEHEARLGQAHAAPDAGHERGAESCLCAPEVLADRGLAVAERPGRAADGTVLGDRPHDAHRVQVEVWLHAITLRYVWHATYALVAWMPPREARQVTSPALDAAIAQFGDPRGYLAVASIGLPPRSAVDALTADLAAWAAADRDPQGY